MIITTLDQLKFTSKIFFSTIVSTSTGCYVFSGNQKTKGHTPEIIQYFNYVKMVWKTIIPIISSEGGNGNGREGGPVKNTILQSGAWDGENKIYLFGGSVYGKGSETDYLENSYNSLYVYHMYEEKLERITCEGFVPQQRCGSSMIYYKEGVYIYGGSTGVKISQQREIFDDMWRYDVREKKWEIMKTKGKRPGLTYHTATLMRDTMYVFGGLDRPSVIDKEKKMKFKDFVKRVILEEPRFYASNEMWSYNLKSKIWKKIKPHFLVTIKPTSRMLHSAAVVGDSIVYTFGVGSFVPCRVKRSIYSFNTRTYVWTKLDKLYRSNLKSKHAKDNVSTVFYGNGCVFNHARNDFLVIGGQKKQCFIMELNHSRFLNAVKEEKMKGGFETHSNAYDTTGNVI